MSDASTGSADALVVGLLAGVALAGAVLGLAAAALQDAGRVRKARPVEEPPWRRWTSASDPSPSTGEGGGGGGPR